MFKYEIHCKDKVYLNLDVVAGKNIVENSREECVKKCKILALDSLFNEDDLLVLLTKTQSKHLMKYKNEIEENGDGIGIVSQIADDKPQFIHRTFAEYFVAIFFVDNLKKEEKDAQNVVEYFLKNLVNEENSVICDFVDSLLNDETLVHNNKYGELITNVDGHKLYFVLEKKWRNIAEILVENGTDLNYKN